MKRILVTGGLGYIGSHTVVVLQEAGFDVVIIDDLSNASISVLDNISTITGKKPSFYEIDLKDKSKVDAFFETEKIDGIIHFAAFKAVGESVEKPLAYYRNNIVGLLNVLDAMQQYQLDHFIFSSSCTVYGQADQMPINEDTPLKRAESPYGKTKAMGEEIISDFTKASNKNAIALRYFNPVGSHKSSLLGDIPNGIPNNLLPYITQTASGLRKQLAVFGNDYETRDGTAIRDYIDVNDLANAHLLALQFLLEKRNQDRLEYFNLGSGTGSTVLEIIKAFEQANDLKLPYTISNRREGDIQEAFADYSKAKNKLNWQPSTSLEVSMKTAWEFEKKLKLNE
ncbi:UDP-glucose 4-epimerase GalE [Paenimyroides tangerinum]|uniref:UDP-glucose 4-epimerase n=1 Tax=Paenimyroides tangerinum TaxID=2488728 RepID=A0A3P3W016_9FLAO|nr:UDP-glucose 4-epimerase GalE [Paenimyroides tangerinum]RRJ88104.1 UDP-glucose 4-epimerase GalE [Paenimyroides tangerinum]